MNAVRKESDNPLSFCGDLSNPDNHLEDEFFTENKRTFMHLHKIFVRLNMFDTNNAFL